MSRPGAPNATNPDKNDGSGYDATGRDGVERVLGLMEARGREKGFGDECWVGVMGFSQGTRVAGGILLDQQRREKLKRENGALARRAVGEGIRVAFGVLCNGGGVPMDSEVGFSMFPPPFLSVFLSFSRHALNLGADWLRIGYPRYGHPDTDAACARV